MMRSLVTMLLAVPSFGTLTLTKFSNSGCVDQIGAPEAVCSLGHCCPLGMSSTATMRYYRVTDIDDCIQSGRVTIAIHEEDPLCSSPVVASITSTTDATCKVVDGINIVLQSPNLEYTKLICQLNNGRNGQLDLHMWMGPGCNGIPLQTTSVPIQGDVNSAMKKTAVASRNVKPLDFSWNCPEDVNAGLRQCNVEFDPEENCSPQYKKQEVACNPNNQLHIATATFADSQCSIPKSFIGDLPSTMSIPINGQCVNVYNGFMSVKASADSTLVASLCGLVNDDPALREALGYTEYSAFIAAYPYINGVSSVAPTLAALLVALVLMVL